MSTLSIAKLGVVELGGLSLDFVHDLRLLHMGKNFDEPLADFAEYS